MDEQEKADSSEAPSVVELRETRPGVYEPSAQTCDEVRPRIRRRLRSKSQFDMVESEVVEGFKAGMGLMRKIGKALNVKV